MGSVLTAVLIVGIIGLVCGIALAVASIVLAVPVDEKAEAITEMLPGANCGACGFSGCILLTYLSPPLLIFYGYYNIYF